MCVLKDYKYKCFHHNCNIIITNAPSFQKDDIDLKIKKNVQNKQKYLKYKIDEN